MLPYAGWSALLILGVTLPLALALVAPSWQPTEVRLRAV